jgi:arylsulfatase A-like enzyme
MDAHDPYNTTPVDGVVNEPVSEDPYLRNKLARQIRKGKVVDKQLQQAVIDQYDVGIANADAGVGALLDTLKSLGLYDNTVIILTSDHGEAFGEHDVLGHGWELYQHGLWVPLIVKAPLQHKSTRDRTPISLCDIPHLLFSHVDKHLSEDFSEEFPNRQGNHPIIAENYFAKMEVLSMGSYGKRFKRVRTAIVDWPYKYIASSDERDEFYNLKRDPQEESNRLAAEKKRSARLAEELSLFQKSRLHAAVVGDTLPLSDEELKKLRALGYIK